MKILEGIAIRHIFHTKDFNETDLDKMFAFQSKMYKTQNIQNANGGRHKMSKTQNGHMYNEQNSKCARSNKVVQAK